MLSFNYPHTDLFINGVWRPSITGERLPVLNPANNEQIGTVARAGLNDLEHAVRSANESFEIWSRTSAYERCKIMRKAAELLRQRAHQIAWLMTCEQGKPLAQSMGEVSSAADVIDWFAEEGKRAYGQVIPSRSPEVIQVPPMRYR